MSIATAGTRIRIFICIIENVLPIGNIDSNRRNIKECQGTRIRSLRIIRTVFFQRKASDYIVRRTVFPHDIQVAVLVIAEYIGRLFS